MATLSAGESAAVLPAPEVMLPLLHTDSSEAPPAAAVNRRNARRSGGPMSGSASAIAVRLRAFAAVLSASGQW